MFDSTKRSPLDPDSATHGEPIAKRLVDRLRHAIVTMALKPGAKLSEQDIASRYGVSRQPVREAFIKLSDAGLVRVMPQRGTMVVKISMEAVNNARFIREAIECAVVREAALVQGGDYLGELYDCLDDSYQALLENDLETFFAVDEQFHQTLAHAANRSGAWQMVTEHKAQMDRVRYLDLNQSIPTRIVQWQHTAIVACISMGNPDAAELAMRSHLYELTVSLPKLQAQLPDLFEPQ